MFHESMAKRQKAATCQNSKASSEAHSDRTCNIHQTSTRIHASSSSSPSVVATFLLKALPLEWERAGVLLRNSEAMQYKRSTTCYGEVCGNVWCLGRSHIPRPRNRCRGTCTKKKMQGGLHETLPKPYQLSNLQKSTCAQRKRLYCTKGRYIL
jgi:hypothetical protein